VRLPLARWHNRFLDPGHRCVLCDLAMLSGSQLTERQDRMYLRRAGAQTAPNRRSSS
jgi:hypothetical protein